MPRNRHRACLVLQGLSGEILEKILESASRSARCSRVRHRAGPAPHHRLLGRGRWQRDLVRRGGTDEPDPASPRRPGRQLHLDRHHRRLRPPTPRLSGIPGPSAHRTASVSPAEVLRADAYAAIDSAIEAPVSSLGQLPDDPNDGPWEPRSIQANPSRRTTQPPMTHAQASMAQDNSCWGRRALLMTRGSASAGRKRVPVEASCGRGHGSANSRRIRTASAHAKRPCAKCGGSRPVRR